MFLVSRWLSVSNRASFSLERHSSFVRIRTGANAEPIKPENSPTPCSMQKAEDVLGGSVCVCVASASDLLITCCVPAPVPACCSSPAVGRPFSVLLFPFSCFSRRFYFSGGGKVFLFFSFFFFLAAGSSGSFRPLNPPRNPAAPVGVGRHCCGAPIADRFVPGIDEPI